MKEKTAAPDPDVALLERARRANPAAIDELMARYAARVYRLAFGITRNHADAEEVVQDVFLTVLRDAHGFEGGAALGITIDCITTNLALDKERSKGAELESSLEEMLPTFTPDGHREGDRDHLLANWSDNPEQTLQSDAAQMALARAIGRLPAPYRAVLVLRDVEGAPHEEVAELLGESVATVKSRLHRARMALRESLTHYWTMAAGAAVRAAVDRPASAEAGGAASTS